MIIKYILCVLDYVPELHTKVHLSCFTSDITVHQSISDGPVSTPSVKYIRSCVTKLGAWLYLSALKVGRKKNSEVELVASEIYLTTNYISPKSIRIVTK